MAEYFSHDYGSRNDPKLINLQIEMGHEGKGLFWDIIEIMYEQGGYITKAECKGIAFALHSDIERITKVLTGFDLFKNDGEKFWSDSVIRRLKIRDEKSEKAKKSALKRWQNTDLDANAMRTHSEGNAKKDIKGKEIKEKKVKDSKERVLAELVFPFDGERFMVAWKILINQPKWKNKTQDAYQAALKKLSVYPEQVAIEAIEDSISGNYQGVFPEKFLKNGNNKASKTPNRTYTASDLRYSP